MQVGYITVVYYQYIIESYQVGGWAVIFNKCMTSVCYLTARENEVELLTTKFYNLHIPSVEKLHEESVCHKVEGVQLRFVQIQHLKATQQNRHAFIFYQV